MYEMVVAIDGQKKARDCCTKEKTTEKIYSLSLCGVACGTWSRLSQGPFEALSCLITHCKHHE